MKRCTACEVEKPKTEFYKHSKNTLRNKCKVCLRADQRHKYAEDGDYRERRKQRSKEYKEKNRRDIRESYREWYTKNGAQHRRRTNTRRRDKRRKDRAWANSANAWKRCKMGNRVPKWVKLPDFYATYAECHALGAETHVVDHIIPLRGKTVSGLHVPGNLRVITHKTNLRKGNKWDE